MKKNTYIVEGVNFTTKDCYEEYLRLLHTPEVSDLAVNVELPLIINGFLVCYAQVEFQYIRNGKRVFHRHLEKWYTEMKMKWKMLQALYPESQFVLTGNAEKKTPKKVRCESTNSYSPSTIHTTQTSPILATTTRS